MSGKSMYVITMAARAALDDPTRPLVVYCMGRNADRPMQAAIQLYSPLGASFDAGKSEFTFPSGARIVFVDGLPDPPPSRVSIRLDGFDWARDRFVGGNPAKWRSKR